MHGAAAQLRGARRGTVVREGLVQVLVAAAGALVLVRGWSTAAFVLAVLCTAAVLLARWRWPSLALVAVAPLVALDATGAAVAALVVAFAEGRREATPRGRLGVFTVASVLCLAVALAVPAADPPHLRLIDAGLGVVFLLVLPGLCGVLVGHRRLATRLLRERNDHLERARALTTRHARLEERSRITAEMHDVLGHRLSLLSVHAGALELTALSDAPRLSVQAALVRATAVAALDELRATLTSTPDPPGRPDVAPGAEPGGRDQVEELVRASRRAGAEVDLVWEVVDGPPAPSAGRAVDRTVREGLTNAAKHAPGAPVVVSLRRVDGRVRVGVRNGPAATGVDGDARPGPRPGPGTRLGLLGLAERATLLGGSARWGPTDGGGFELVVEVPADPPATATPDAAVEAADAVLLSPPPVRRGDELSGRRVVGLFAVLGVFFLPVTLLLVIVAAFVLLL